MPLYTERQNVIVKCYTHGSLHWYSTCMNTYQSKWMQQWGLFLSYPLIFIWAGVPKFWTGEVTVSNLTYNHILPYAKTSTNVLFQFILIHFHKLQCNIMAMLREKKMHKSSWFFKNLTVVHHLTTIHCQETPVKIIN